MSQRLKELRDKRGKMVAEMRALLDAAKTAKRELTNEESAKYDELYAEQESIEKTIEAETRQIELDRETAAADRNDERDNNRDDNEDRGDNRQSGPRSTREYNENFRNYLLGGSARGLERGAESRALSANNNAEGGYIVTPEQFVAELIKAMDNLVHVRRRATRLQVTSGASIGMPSLDADPADADWTVELDTGSEDSTMAFGKRKMTAHPLAKLIKISNQLIRSSAIPIDQLVRDRLAYKFGVTQEKAYYTGTGVDQPLGMFTASDAGIPTSRDISTDNTSTAITFDGLINAKYSLKPQYWAKASWSFHRDAMKMISKIKDTVNGGYVWRPSVRDGEPDTILNHQVDVSEYVPNTFTSGQYVGLFADMTYYWILDALDFQIQRLVELYARTNQVGMIGRYEGDGAPVLAEAFARVKLG